MRDMILVERVTDGERCGDCDMRYVDDGYGVEVCAVFGGEIKQGVRVEQCLATKGRVSWDRVGGVSTAKFLT